MTLKEIRETLADTKVYVADKSKEVQEKLFLLGYKWPDGDTRITHESKPFLYIYKDLTVCYGINMDVFINNQFRKITAEQILALELTEHSYRPFKNQDECWEEMLKHQPFGWLIGKVSGFPTFIPFVLYNSLFIHDTKLTYEEAMGQYTFADGTPFGIKED